MEYFNKKYHCKDEPKEHFISYEIKKELAIELNLPAEKDM